MKLLRHSEDEANPFLSVNVIDSKVEEAGIKVFILDENESNDVLIDVEEICEKTLY